MSGIPEERAAPGRTDLALCWGTVGAKTVPDLVEAAAAAGFTGVTVQPAMGAADLGAAECSLADHGLRAAYVDPLLTALPGSAKPHEVAPEHRRFFAHGEADCFRVAEAVGAERVNVAHFLGSAVPVTAMTEAFGHLCERAGRQGLRLALEFIPGTGIPDLATALEIVIGAGAGNAGVQLDTWHLVRSGGGVADVVAAPPGTIEALQLSDRAAAEAEESYVPMVGRLLPGEGDLPLRELVAAALANNVRAALSVEVFSGELQALPPAEAARRAYLSAQAVM